MIGLSISCCFGEMASGKVDPATVTKVISRTAFETPEQQEQMVQSYRSSFWVDNPDEAEGLFLQFLSEGRIEQPRLSEEQWFPALREGQRPWVESEQEVEKIFII